MHRRKSLSAIEDEIGTETESEPEERIQSASLIGIVTLVNSQTFSH